MAQKKSKWSALKKGDIVDVVAPAWSCTHDELVDALKYVESLGLVPRVPVNIFSGDKLYAQSDEKRFGFLKSALLDRHSKAIWAVRGGYGSFRLLPELAKIKKPKQTKLFIGFSDMTSLHHFFNHQWGWPTLHGPVLKKMGQASTSKAEKKSVIEIIFGQQKEVSFLKLKPMNAKAKKKQTINAKISGGNLTVMQTCLGTPWQYKNDGLILAFEDTGERGYRVDKVLEHMHQAGFFKGVKAILFGQFDGGLEKNGESLCYKAIQRFADQNRLPVFKGLPVGHGKIQKPLPLWTPSRLRVSNGRTELIVKSGF